MELTHRETIPEKELSEHFIFSKRKARRSEKIAECLSCNAQAKGKSRVTEQLP